MFSNPLHVRCGDDILDKLKAAGLPGRRMKWCDPVCVGPTPRTPDQNAWYRMRARYLVRMTDHPVREAEAALREQDEALRDVAPHDALVLWFEHDLFDQSILIAVLSKLADDSAANGRLYIVTTDRFPGHERFVGLGQLTPSELRTLYDTATRVTPAQITLARRTWDAWQAASPMELQHLLDSDTSALPFLAAAIRRHLQDLPWTRDGLSLTERLILTSLSSAHMSAGDLFQRVQDAEEHPWMGDANLFDEVERMRFLPQPLVNVASDKPVRRHTVVGATALARNILIGGVDALSVSPGDRWVGGVRVTPTCPWRWNGRVVASNPGAPEVPADG